MLADTILRLKSIYLYDHLPPEEEGLEIDCTIFEFLIPVELYGVQHEAVKHLGASFPLSS